MAIARMPAFERATPAERREISRYEKIALSDGQLRRLLPGIRIVLYPDIHRMRSLDEVMGPEGAAIILFEARPSYGHWCAIFRGAGGDDGLVEFFNPYGGYPDDSLKLIDRRFAAASNQDEPHLSRLMIESPYRLSYNQYGFQRHGPDIKTCGRHCASRLMLRWLPLDEYRDWISDLSRRTRTDPDAIVSGLTREVGVPR